MPRLKLPHTAIVKQLVTGDPDRLGVPQASWVAVGGPVPVYRQRAGGRELPTPAGETAVAEYTIFAGPHPPFTAAHRLEIDGAIHEIADLDPDVAGRGHHSEATARVVATAQVA